MEQGFVNNREKGRKEVEVQILTNFESIFSFAYKYRNKPEDWVRSFLLEIEKLSDRNKVGITSKINICLSLLKAILECSCHSSCYSCGDCSCKLEEVVSMVEKSDILQKVMFLNMKSQVLDKIFYITRKTRFRDSDFSKINISGIDISHYSFLFDMPPVRILPNCNYVFGNKGSLVNLDDEGISLIETTFSISNKGRDTPHCELAESYFERSMSFDGCSGGVVIYMNISGQKIPVLFVKFDGEVTSLALRNVYTKNGLHIRKGMIYGLNSKFFEHLQFLFVSSLQDNLMDSTIFELDFQEVIDFFKDRNSCVKILALRYLTGSYDFIERFNKAYTNGKYNRRISQFSS